MPGNEVEIISSRYNSIKRYPKGGHTDSQNKKKISYFYDSHKKKVINLKFILTCETKIPEEISSPRRKKLAPVLFCPPKYYTLVWD